MSYVLHVNYRFAPKWNLFAKGMYETASVYKASDEVEKVNIARHGDMQEE